MSKNIPEIPLTEIIERVMDITRAPENSRYRVKAACNDIYCREIPFKWDWNFLLASSSIITEKEYTTGSLSVNTGSTSVVFSSDVSIDASATGKQLKVSGNDVVYDFTYSNATAGTITPSFQGPSNASANSYSIYQSEYTLADNFDRFPKNGGVYKWIGGKKEILEEESFQEESKYFAGSPSTPEKVRLVETDTLGRQMIRFRPAPNSAKVYGYDYIKKLSPLTENTAGTISINSQGTAVTGDASCKFTQSSVGDYLRVDSRGTRDESTWYRIASITNDTSLTLCSAFENLNVTSANYVISKAPDIPAKMHPAIIYGAIRSIIVDQSDPNAMYYVNKYSETLNDAKRLYVSRVYNQKVETIAEEFLYRR